MAEGIDTAMLIHAPLRAGEEPTRPAALRDRRRTGVIEHLHDTTRAFVVNVRDSGSPAIEREVRIDV